MSQGGGQMCPMLLMGQVRSQLGRAHWVCNVEATSDLNGTSFDGVLGTNRTTRGVVMQQRNGMVWDSKSRIKTCFFCFKREEIMAFC